ncbi:MAG: thermonuclease family protein [Pseudomonadota bacterium]
MTLLLSLALSLCPDAGRRYTCVHDGDSLVYKTERLRIADIDTPELNGQCPYEIAKAKEARDRLLELLNERGLQFTRVGTDRYGRTLVEMPAVSEQLIREGLARRWKGKRENWC